MYSSIFECRLIIYLQTRWKLSFLWLFLFCNFKTSEIVQRFIPQGVLAKCMLLKNDQSASFCPGQRCKIYHHPLIDWFQSLPPQYQEERTWLNCISEGRALGTASYVFVGSSQQPPLCYCCWIESSQGSRPPNWLLTTYLWINFTLLGQLWKKHKKWVRWRW